MIPTELYENTTLLHEGSCPLMSQGDEVMLDGEPYCVAKVQYLWSSATRVWVQCVMLAPIPKAWRGE
jgi:hypothetical protein